MKHKSVVFIVLLMSIGFALMTGSSNALSSQIRGTVYWLDQYGNLRPLQWAEVTATGDNSAPVVTSSAVDGTYMMWVAPGTYNLTVSLDPGYAPASKMVTVSEGGAVTADFELEPSGKPIPEYPSLAQPAMLLIAALATAVLVRRRGNVPLPQN